MYKQRDKYFTTNSKNLVNRILNQKGHFTPYEFMSLRYACCQKISELSIDNQGIARWYAVYPVKDISNNEIRKNKLKIKEYQRCINHLDNWFRGELK